MKAAYGVKAKENGGGSVNGIAYGVKMAKKSKYQQSATRRRQSSAA
jgi:hypothetical protein